jgi:hypothetical protein
MSLPVPRSPAKTTDPQALAARKKGTAVTKESFAKWAVQFEREFAEILKREEDERLKALPPKEREEARRWAAKLSGGCCPSPRSSKAALTTNLRRPTTV